MFIQSCIPLTFSCKLSMNSAFLLKNNGSRKINLFITRMVLVQVEPRTEMRIYEKGIYKPVQTCKEFVDG